MALKVFSEEVENDIRIHGDSVTAQFGRLIRRWFYACADKGVDVKNRLQWLVDMNNYMNQFFEVSDYPWPSTHIYNLPIQRFEMIMQATSIHIALYLLSEKHKFNNRLISTGGVKSTFLDLSIVEITGTGCPKAYQFQN